MLSFVKTNTLNYLLPRVRLIFTEMEMTGNVVMSAKTGRITCPYTLLNRYIQAAGIDFSSNQETMQIMVSCSNLMFFARYISCTLRSTGISYTHTRFACF